ncbi:hypothetical protein IMSHALPRED_006093 [Imshaugia aleurites]|uniref:Uncharacterized protein n=1 Tax=Imshaugia aleurites TaxID=172621 RepID=A0A8H3IS82_9LECA|nr:hypothetical protein IMSHALPRED_006093 [Imshaugia aleurites]
MDLVGISLLLSLALLTLPIAHAIPSPTSQKGSEATIKIANEIFVVDPTNIVLDSTTIQAGAAGVSVDGQIVSADAAYDLYVDGSEILAGQAGVPITSSGATTSGTTNSGNSSLSPWSTGSTSSASNNAGSVTTSGLPSGTVSTSLDLSLTTTFPKVSAPSSLPTSSSTHTGPSQPYIVSLAATPSSYSSSSRIGSTANVSPVSQASKSISAASFSLSASGNSSRIMSSSTLINNSTGSNTLSVASTRSQSVSFKSWKTSSRVSSGLAISVTTSSGALILGSTTQPSTITPRPSLATSAIFWNPTGSAASSQGILLVGAIFEITDEAKTLSAILEDEGPKESFLFEDLKPPDPPPSYEDSCLHGASIFDILEDLGCLKSGFEEVISLLEAEPPDVPEIQTVFGNLGDLANNLKEEEDDDDDDDQTRTDENPTKTQTSAAKSSSIPSSSTVSASSRMSSGTPKSSISITSGTLTIASSRLSSSRFTTASSTLSSSSALFSTALAGLDMSPIFDYGPSDPDVSDEDALAFFGDLLSSAMGIGSGLSGFATSTTANKTVLTTTSQRPPATSATTEKSSRTTLPALESATASKSSESIISIIPSKGPTVTSEKSAAVKATTSRALSTSSAGRGGHTTSSIISSTPVTTTMPVPVTTDPPIATHSALDVGGLKCTQLFVPTSQFKFLLLH